MQMFQLIYEVPHRYGRVIGIASWRDAVYIATESGMILKMFDDGYGKIETRTVSPGESV